MIRVEPVNATYIKVLFDDFGIEQEFSEFCSFFAPNYKFMPAFKQGRFDGKIRLFNLRNKTIYKGLLEIVYKFAIERKYEISINPTLADRMDVSLDATKSIVKQQNLKNSIVVRDYQYEALQHVFSRKRCILIAATSAGKSLVIYSMIRKWQDEEKQTLLIVPNLNLVKQMYSDFIDYSADNGWDVMENVHTLYSGQERVFDKPICISTWQTLLSMLKNDPKNFAKIAQFDCIIGDECIHPDSNVTMASGELKKINELKVGELVKTVNETTGEIESKEIIKIHKNISVDERKFKLKTKSGNELIVTGNHKVYTQRGWIRVDGLNITDEIKI